MDSHSPSLPSGDADSDEFRGVDENPPRDAVPSGRRDPSPADPAWIEEIDKQLADDPEEGWQALESLSLVEPEIRETLVESLSGFRERPGVARLLRLLDTAPVPRAAWASRAAQAALAAPGELRPGARASHVVRTHDPLTEEHALARRSPDRAASCAVTAVDSHGRGWIVVSVTRARQRRTAAFLCDLERGIVDVAGLVEPESPSAGGLVDQLVDQAGDDCVRDQPGLAIGLLAGSLMLNGRHVPAAIRDWLDGVLGAGFQPAGFPATIADFDPASIALGEIPGRAARVLDACPTWIDSSPLTFELAEEIWLREGRLGIDAERDAGAYRFLFEHRLIHRLELYRRMLLWMAELWRHAGRHELWQSALLLACQLSDEQYAVPSYPFTLGLTTRSFAAAQSQLRTAHDPRSGRA